MIGIDVTRFVGDTWPITHIIEVNGNVVNLVGSRVYLYYGDVDGAGDPVVVRIKGLTSSVGKAKFYPRDKYGMDLTNGVPVVPFSKAGEYDYSIVREHDIYELDDNGSFVIVGGEPVPYDSSNADHDGLRKHSVFTEVMTHAVGRVSVHDRVGV